MRIESRRSSLFLCATLLALLGVTGAGPEFSSLGAYQSPRSGADAGGGIDRPPYQIGIAKALSGNPSDPENDGTFRFAYLLTLKNTGTQPLYQLQVEDDLESVFFPVSGDRVRSWSLVGVSLVAPSGLTLNPDFDGSGDIRLLSGSDTIAPDEEERIRIEVEVALPWQLDPACGGACLQDRFTFYNAAHALAASAPTDGTSVQDWSQNGIDVDPNDNNDTTDNDEPTETVLKPEAYTISGRIWFDTNGNGLQDPGEPGLPGTVFPDLEVKLFYFEEGTCQTGDLLTSVSPAADGSYAIPVIDGSYCLEVAGLPAGWSYAPLHVGLDETVDSDGAPVSDEVIVSGASVGHMDFGMTVRGSISGTVWCENEIPPNDTYDPPTDVTIPGALVQLDIDADCDGSADDDTVDGTDAVPNTGPTSVYSFADLEVGIVGAGDPICYLLSVDPESIPPACPNAWTAIERWVALAYDPATGQGTEKTGQNFGYIDEEPEIGLAKFVSDGPTELEGQAGVYHVSLLFTVDNSGDMPLDSVTVVDDLATTFAGAVSWSLLSVQRGDFLESEVRGDYTGAPPTDTLVSNATLDIGERKRIQITVEFKPGGGDKTFLNTAFAGGRAPFGTRVDDQSDDGLEPDDNGNGDPTDDSDPTEIHTKQPVLSVTVSAFTAEATGEGVVLRWETESESGQTGYGIEQAFEDGPFEGVAEVESRGSATSAAAYTHIVERPRYGRHRFRLRMVDREGAVSFSPVVEVVVEVPGEVVLEGVFPNPVRGEGQLRFAVRQSQQVQVDLFTVSGQRLKRLFDGTPEPGRSHSVRFDARELPAGVYLVRLVSEEGVRSERVVVVR